MEDTFEECFGEHIDATQANGNEIRDSKRAYLNTLPKTQPARSSLRHTGDGEESRLHHDRQPFARPPKHSEAEEGEHTIPSAGLSAETQAQNISGR